MQKGEQFFAVAFESAVVVVALEEALWECLVLLGEEEVGIGLLFESEGVDELVVFLEVLVVAEEEDDFVDVVFGADRRAQRTHQAVPVLHQVAVDDRFHQ